MALLGRLLGALIIAGGAVYHAQQMRRLVQQSTTRRPHVFLVVTGTRHDHTTRRPVVLRNGGDLPARNVTVRVTRDAMIWTNARGEPDPSLREERLPFSALDVCRHGVLGIPPGDERPIAFLTPAGRWLMDREQRLECTIAYEDGEGVRYEESVGIEYLA